MWWLLWRWFPKLLLWRRRFRLFESSRNSFPRISDIYHIYIYWCRPFRCSHCMHLENGAITSLNESSWTKLRSRLSRSQLWKPIRFRLGQSIKLVEPSDRTKCGRQKQVFLLIIINRIQYLMNHQWWFRPYSLNYKDLSACRYHIKINSEWMRIRYHGVPDRDHTTRLSSIGAFDRIWRQRNFSRTKIFENRRAVGPK